MNLSISIHVAERVSVNDIILKAIACIVSLKPVLCRMLWAVKDNLFISHRYAHAPPLDMIPNSDLHTKSVSSNMPTLFAVYKKVNLNE